MSPRLVGVLGHALSHKRHGLDYETRVFVTLRPRDASRRPLFSLHRHDIAISSYEGEGLHMSQSASTPHTRWCAFLICYYTGPTTAELPSVLR